MFIVSILYPRALVFQMGDTFRFQLISVDNGNTFCL